MLLQTYFVLQLTLTHNSDNRKIILSDYEKRNKQLYTYVHILYIYNFSYPCSCFLTLILSSRLYALIYLFCVTLCCRRFGRAMKINSP